jgi:ABC-type transporter Mla maintaining outer membrane lipid asymmetry permease subunit MlaE
MAAELGTMKVTEQVDALRSLPQAPRSIWWCPSTRDAHHAADHHDFEQRCGMMGGYIAAVSNGVAPNIYWQSFKIW